MTNQQSDTSAAEPDAPAAQAVAEQADGAAEPAAAGPPAGRRRGRLAFAAALAAVIVAGAGTAAVFAAVRGHGAQLPPRPVGISPAISDGQVSLMGLSALPGDRAPDFTLTDQNGRTLSMSDLRGKAVVLEFMDPHCTDICPIVSAEFVDAYRDLGKLAPKVVFAAVNVNVYHSGVADVLAFSREHQLTTIPDWHFFTGPTPALKAAWGGYHVAVGAPSPTADIVHTSVVFFIDPSGHERYIASPGADHTAKGTAFLPADQIAGWGQGIAQVARTLVR